MLSSVKKWVFGRESGAKAKVSRDSFEIKVHGGGERQASKDLSRIAPDHLNRYKLVAQDNVSGKVLDMACGVGYGSYIIATESAAVIHVDSVDISSDAIEFGQTYYSHSKIQYHCQSALSIDLENHSYDVGVSFETVEHIAEDEQLFLKFNKALKLGARFYFSTPNEEFLPHTSERFPFHVKHYTKAELGDLVRKTGFDIERVFRQKSKKEPLIEQGWDGSYNIVVCRKVSNI